MEATLVSNSRSDLVLGFISLYLLVKSYSNSLVAEVSQQMYGGVLNVARLAVDFYDDQPISLVYRQSPICRSYKEGAVGSVLIGGVLMTIVDQILVSISYQNSNSIFIVSRQNHSDLQQHVVSAAVSKEFQFISYFVLFLLSIYLDTMTVLETVQDPRQLEFHSL